MSRRPHRTGNLTRGQSRVHYLPPPPLIHLCEAPSIWAGRVRIFRRRRQIAQDKLLRKAPTIMHRHAQRRLGRLRDDRPFTLTRQASGHPVCICRPQLEAPARAWREVLPVTPQFAVQVVPIRRSRWEVLVWSLINPGFGCFTLTVPFEPLQQFTESPVEQATKVHKA
jgi:hypothetical protein